MIDAVVEDRTARRPEFLPDPRSRDSRRRHEERRGLVHA
jgi:hypothetical protein